jgi:hypothetical protein
MYSDMIRIIVQNRKNRNSVLDRIYWRMQIKGNWKGFPTFQTSSFRIFQISHLIQQYLIISNCHLKDQNCNFLTYFFYIFVNWMQVQPYLMSWHFVFVIKIQDIFIIITLTVIYTRNQEFLLSLLQAYTIIW